MSIWRSVLVYLIVVFRSAKERPFAERKATDAIWPSQLESADSGDLRCAANHSRTVGSAAMATAARGVWRDGNFLVLDRRSFVVGERCAFTNEPVAGEPHMVEMAGPTDRVPPRPERIKLPMQVSPSWKGAAEEGKKR